MRLIFFLIVFLPFSLFGQTNLLYTIEHPETGHTSYLFGTIHLLCEKDFSWPQQLDEVLDKVDQVYLELDMDDPALMLEMQKFLAMKDGVTLDKLLVEEEYRLVADYFQKNVGIPLSMFNAAKPMLVSSMLYPSLLGCPLKSFETDFVKEASKRNKEVLGLETVAFQMGVFDDITYEEQAKMLLEVVQSPELAAKEFEELVAQYKNGSPDSILKLMQASSFEFSEKSMEKLLVERNKNWVEILNKNAKGLTALYAVGAGHLGGPHGLISLLEKEGFEVKNFSSGSK